MADVSASQNSHLHPIFRDILNAHLSPPVQSGASTAALTYAGDAYSACLHGTADARQQQSAASQIILLHGIKGELLRALHGMCYALNSARLIMRDKEARDYAGELVAAAEKLIDKATGAAK